MWGSSGLALSSAWGTSWCLCGVSCCGSSEMSHAIPPHVFQTLKSHRWNCNVFGRCRKFGYPNCMRVLVDEAPKVNSCVRSSSHDTVHDPRHASTTTPTPHNAKSLITYPDRRFLSACTARTNYRDKDRRTALFSARRARAQGIPARRTRRSRRTRRMKARDLSPNARASPHTLRAPRIILGARRLGARTRG